MTADATSGALSRRIAYTAVAAALLGVFLTWTTDGPVHLDGTQGPNNGWLVALLAIGAIGWLRAAGRGSWPGVVGAFGSALVIGWTAADSWLDGRAVLGASVSFGLLLVLAASVALATSVAYAAVKRER